MTTKLLISVARKYAVKIEKFENKNHGGVKILGWSKKQHGTFFGSKVLADSRNVHVLYPAVKFDLQTYKTCTYLESASTLIPEKVPCCFLDQPPKILTLP
jgi:hypothetical protein